MGVRIRPDKQSEQKKKEKERRLLKEDAALMLDEKMRCYKMRLNGIECSLQIPFY